MRGSSREKKKKRKPNSRKIVELILVSRPGLRAQHLSQHMRQHFPPPGPVVINVRAPQIERVWNALRLEDGGQLLATVRILIRALPRHDVDRIRLSQDREVVTVFQFREVIDRIVKIDVVIVEAIQKVTNIVAAAHRNRALEEIRMLEVFVRGQVRAEARARGDWPSELLFVVVPD